MALPNRKEVLEGRVSLEISEVDIIEWTYKEAYENGFPELLSEDTTRVVGVGRNEQGLIVKAIMLSPLVEFDRLQSGEDEYKIRAQGIAEKLLGVSE